MSRSSSPLTFSWCLNVILFGYFLVLRAWLLNMQNYASIVMNYDIWNKLNNICKQQGIFRAKSSPPSLFSHLFHCHLTKWWWVPSSWKRSPGLLPFWTQPLSVSSVKETERNHQFKWKPLHFPVFNHKHQPASFFYLPKLHMFSKPRVPRILKPCIFLMAVAALTRSS